MTDAPYGVMLHHFHGPGHPDGQGAITAEQFVEMIDVLGPRRFLSPGDWIERALAGRLEPGDLCLTLDDALKCQFDIAAPVMRAYGLTAFWFVYSGVFQGRAERLEIYRDFRNLRFDGIEAFYVAFFDAVARSAWGDVWRARMADFRPRDYLADYSFYTDEDRAFRFVRDRVLGPANYEAVMEAMIAEDAGYDLDAAVRRLWMSDADLIALHGAGHEIGLHSFSHPTRMADLDADQQRAQYSANSDHLTSLLGVRPRSMSHPCNSYGPETLPILAGLGVEIGFRSNLTPCGGGLLEMPRDDHSHILANMARKRAA